MWRELVEGICDDAEFGTPATQHEIDAAARVVGSPLPNDLSSLLMECGEVAAWYGTPYVWSAGRIADENATMYTDHAMADLYLPFEGLLFFGDNGGGDRFAFVMRGGREDVFVWEHESDSRRWVAGGLEDYLRRSLAGGGDSWYEAP